jgi:hypothetical protein
MTTLPQPRPRPDDPALAADVDCLVAASGTIRFTDQLPLVERDRADHKSSASVSRYSSPERSPRRSAASSTRPACRTTSTDGFSMAIVPNSFQNEL